MLKVFDSLSSIKKVKVKYRPTIYAKLLFVAIINLQLAVIDGGSATGVNISCLNCIKIVGDWGFAPDPTGGAYTALFQTP